MDDKSSGVKSEKDLFDLKSVKVADAPILEFDYDESSVSKEKFFNQGKKEFWRFNKVKALSVDKCIIYLPRAFELLESIKCDCELIYEFKSASTISPVYLYKNEVLIALSPLGGPAATNLMEELHFIGIKKFIALGSCGSLSDKFDANKIIIPTSAIRDEGVSYHYLPASRYVETSERINKALEEKLNKHKIPYTSARVWTIDAIYRETPNRIARRYEEGAIAVEMECASLAAVAKHKGIDFGQILYVSDTIKGIDWQLRRYDKVKLRTELLKVCIETIRSLE